MRAGIERTVAIQISGLAAGIVVLAVFAALSGLFWPFPDLELREIVSYRGTQVQLLGTGLYRYETVLVGAGFVGQDWVTLGIAVPLLIATALRARNGGAHHDALLLGVLSYFLYVYATMALGAQFNVLFLGYVALFSMGLFAVVLVARRLASEIEALPEPQRLRLPRRGPAVFLLVAGAVTATIWLMPLLPALAGGYFPSTLGHRTTNVTDVLDLGIIAPSAIVAAVLVLRLRAVGYAIACGLLGIIVMLLPTIVASTVAQMRAGFVFTMPEIVGPIGGFLVLGAIGLWLLVALFRRLREEAPG